MSEMNRFVRVAIRLVLVVSVLYGMGAHWASLQGAAWAGMIATRVSESSWAEAVASTFSGERPCRACRIVEKGAKPGQSETLLRSGPNLDLAYSVVAGMRGPLPGSDAVVPSLPLGFALSFRPVVPPPKPFLPA
jgi:hypothetical protein